MKHRMSTKAFLLAVLMILSVSLSGCVVGGGIENTSPNDMTFPDINTVINPITASPAPSAAAQATDQPGQTGVISSWTAPTPTQQTINLVPHTTPPRVTPPPTSAPSPTPTGSLKLGATGQQVREVQQRLKDLGFYKGSVDGDFGAATETAVKAFQKQYGLEADGKVGTQTMAKLTAARATARPTVSPTPKATATPSFSNNTFLRNGNSGNQVKQLQERLIALGYLLGKSTASFDNATEAAVLAFQRRNGVEADGVAGPNTLSKLYSSSARSASSAAAIVGITLKEGSTEKAAVRLLQTKLKSLSFYTGSVDGDFGAGTAAAVLAFQKANRLTADGAAGGATLNRLFAADVASARIVVATPTPRPTATPRASAVTTPVPSNVYVHVTAAPNNAYFTLKRGMEGEPVKRMQQALKNQGYYTGPVDGYFGDSTEVSVMGFQRSKGLKVDGQAGPATLRVLYEGAFPNGS